MVRPLASAPHLQIVDVRVEFLTDRAEEHAFGVEL